MFTSDRELESYQRARDYIIIVFHDRWYHYRRGTSPCSISIGEDRRQSFESCLKIDIYFNSSKYT